VLRLAIVLENVIPRLLGWVPISWRRAVIGRPDNPSRIATLAHDLLNRVPSGESQVYELWHLVLGMASRKKMRGSPLFPLAFMIFWYAGLLLLLMTFNGMQPYQDFVLNAYLWLLLGILFRSPSLALSAQYATASQIPAAAQLPAAYAPRMR
jgi:hypothetical protein